MKKLFISTMVAMSAMCVNAQVETTPITIADSDLYGIGESYSYNHETSLVSVGYSDKEAVIMHVYGEDLNLKKTITPSEEPIPFSVINLNSNSSDYTMYLTQTLFNDDEKYEYIVSVPQKNQYGYDYSAGLKIMSDDGSVLQTIMFPENVTGYFDRGIKLFIIGSSKYLEGGDYEDADENEYMNLYKINKDAKDPSKVSIATAPMRVSVSPRMASRNQDINVVAEGNGVREVIVTNAAGQVVYSTKVAAGETNVKINSRRLSSGLNVVSVKGADGKEENCKVIVKK